MVTLGASKMHTTKKYNQEKCREADTVIRTCSIVSCPDPANLIAIDTTDLAALRCYQKSSRIHHCIRTALQTPLPGRSVRASALAGSRASPSFPRRALSRPAGAYPAGACEGVDCTSPTAERAAWRVL